MSKNIYILVGPPAAGKSTWVEKEFQGECHVVSTDDIIQVIADNDGKTYNETFAKYIKAAEAIMWQEFDRMVNGDYNPIVVDRTNMSVKSRRKFFERLRNFHKGHGYKIHAVVFPKPEGEEYERRLDSREGKTIPEQALTSMLNSYEIPLKSEGFSDIIFIS